MQYIVAVTTRAIKSIPVLPNQFLRGSLSWGDFPQHFATGNEAGGGVENTTHNVVIALQKKNNRGRSPRLWVSPIYIIAPYFPRS